MTNRQPDTDEQTNYDRSILLKYSMNVLIEINSTIYDIRKRWMGFIWRLVNGVCDALRD